jgi:hypothetical protein
MHRTGLGESEACFVTGATIVVGGGILLSTGLV